MNNNTTEHRTLPRPVRDGFWGLIVALCFALLNAVYYVGVFAKAAFETVFLGRDAKRQLRQYEDDINGRF